MNKKDLIPVAGLIVLMIAWFFIDRTFIAPKFPAAAPVPAEQPAEPIPEAGNIEDAALTAAKPAAEQPAAAPAVIDTEVPADEIVKVLENENLRIELTSLGGGIKSATLFQYPEFDQKESPPVMLDFSDSAALAYQGLTGIGAKESLNIEKSADGKSVTFSKTWNSGALFERTLTIGDDYLLTVNDRFINNSSDPWNISGLRLLSGNMTNPADMKATKGISILGVDSYSVNDELNYWGKKLNKLYKNADKAASIDAVPEGMSNQQINWLAAKNKFFVQIISPQDEPATMAILSTRDTSEKAILPNTITAALALSPIALDAGETKSIEYAYFIGPKKYSTLKETGNNYEKVMEFETTGFFSWMNWLMEPSRKGLLWTLNLFHGMVHNYGVAIILLTLLVRILFWPLTHKSTESMKRMQEVQPQIKAIQEKYKKDPQRAQQEVMKFYKENKVNPMGGCLPMVIQIPVFIALFTVLRNAIELRYSGFLWIADLSQPENLFAGSIPVIGSLNILPLLMSVSMIWQQKLSTPGTAATPEQQQQQKMMMFMMPIMMLFFFYTMPSGLVLYWTTSNLLMIAQTSFRNLKKKTKEA
ncbi:membrane protein insertase YidC [Pontiellaceae bacterium B12227]|nr:membrane protein insertase YidC [Pontiellaceae bacterium B12227]